MQFGTFAAPLLPSPPSFPFWESGAKRRVAAGAAIRAARLSLAIASDPKANSQDAKTAREREREPVCGPGHEHAEAQRHNKPMRNGPGGSAEGGVAIVLEPLFRALFLRQIKHKFCTA